MLTLILMFLNAPPIIGRPSVEGTMERSRKKEKKRLLLLLHRNIIKVLLQLIVQLTTMIYLIHICNLSPTVRFKNRQ